METVDKFTFPAEEFLATFPVFADETVYPSTLVTSCGIRAHYHVTHDVFGFPMRGPHRFYALFLMTAHLIVLDKQDDDAIGGGGPGSSGGMAFKATVGSVTIEKTKPNSFTSDDLDFWLSQTKYGRELLAYLETRAPLGVYINGRRDSVRVLN